VVRTGITKRHYRLRYNLHRRWATASKFFIHIVIVKSILQWLRPYRLGKDRVLEVVSKFALNLSIHLGA
jgi:hypothetical protein